MNTTSDILILGGGVIGLAIAIELKRRGADVTIISRDSLKECNSSIDRAKAASQAAAGMLAPLAENITFAPMLELCLRSRWLYPEWTRKLEELTGVNAGYWPCGILSPLYKLPDNILSKDPAKIWLDRHTLEFYQKGLSEDVVGAWWYPEDAQVDNLALVSSLLQAAEILGVKIQDNVRVEAIQQRQGKVNGVLTNLGELKAQTYVLAAGCWSSQLFPLPVRPIKGQMASLKMPGEKHQPLPLDKVLFGTNTYLVPRRNGRLIIGATSEDVGYTPYNDPQGIQTLLGNASKLYPALANWQIEEFWWGYRPGTKDELPILGTSSCENLILATGHYRNGILLAPITGLLIADLIWQQQVDPLLSYFNGDRFYSQSKTQSPQMIAPNNISSISPASATPVVAIEQDNLIVAGRKFQSRLMTGTGKYPNIETMQQSVVTSGCEIVTVAVRRVQTNAPGHEGLAEALDWNKIWMLPNTAGCQTAEEAIRVARLGREMAKLLGQEDNNFVKLEVIPDAKYLLPDPIGTLQAAEQLVKEGFAVLPYINADPLLAKRLEEIGCATVMPLGSPIGSGQGIRNAANIAIIIEEAKVPVVVDAGIGSPSEAAQAMEMGADALLINSAIALAVNPPAMAQAFGMATKAGRLGYLAGRIPVKAYATASSPQTGIIRGD
jgi:thiazole synthase